MKRFTVLAQLILIVGVCSAGYAKPVADLEAEHKALRKMKAIYEDVLNNGKDPNTFAPYLAKNFVAVLATGDEVKGIKDLKAFWEKTQEQLGPGGGYTEKFEPDLTDFYGDIAVAHGKASQHITSRGKEIDTETSWLLVAQKQDGIWKIIRAQSTMDPINNAIIGLMIQQAKWTFGLSGLAIGLIAGFVIFRLRKAKAA